MLQPGGWQGSLLPMPAFSPFNSWDDIWRIIHSLLSKNILSALPWWFQYAPSLSSPLLTTNTGICDWLLAFSTIQGACVVHWLITRLVCLENSKEEGIVRTKGKFREEDRTNSRSIRTGIMLFALIPEQNVCWIVTRLVIYRRSEEKRARRGYTVKFSNHKYLSKKRKNNEDD